MEACMRYRTCWSCILLYLNVCFFLFQDSETSLRHSELSFQHTEISNFDFFYSSHVGFVPTNIAYAVWLSNSFDGYIFWTLSHKAYWSMFHTPTYGLGLVDVFAILAWLSALQFMHRKAYSFAIFFLYCFEMLKKQACKDSWIWFCSLWCARYWRSKRVHRWSVSFWGRSGELVTLCRGACARYGIAQHRVQT